MDPSIIIAFVAASLIAVQGIIDAKRKKEPIKWPLFIKTIVIAAGSAGFISQTQSGFLIEISSTTVVTYLLDKLVNSIIR